MGFQIVIAGESQCDKFAQVCLIADYLAQNLPNFCYRRIEKPVLEWKAWLSKVNHKNNWHHVGTVIIWKELLMEGSKAYYIGGASEFLEYCHSYYHFDKFIALERLEDLTLNFGQLSRKWKRQQNLKYLEDEQSIQVPDIKDSFTICISGASHPLTMYLISGFLDISYEGKKISKIYIYDENHGTLSFLEFVERECNYVGTGKPIKVVKCVEKIGMALTNSDLLIILEHIPFKKEYSIGGWLRKNKKLMKNLGLMINASASRHICIILPNFGPACYNATVLRNTVTNIKKNNIVVATCDLGLDVASIAAKIAEIPMRNIFCPPVWGFVGINHLVDIRTTVHKYNSFEPLKRFSKVRNSSLCIGTLVPEMRTMEYLLHFDENLWLRISNNSNKGRNQDMSKAVSVINVVKLWLFEKKSDYIISLGVYCDGSFGLTFDGVFSQPVQYKDDEWKPANTFLTPRDPQINIRYLEKIAKFTMELEKDDLPYTFCSE